MIEESLQKDRPIRKRYTCWPYAVPIPARATDDFQAEILPGSVSATITNPQLKSRRRCGPDPARSASRIVRARRLSVVEATGLERRGGRVPDAGDSLSYRTRPTVPAGVYQPRPCLFDNPFIYQQGFSRCGVAPSKSVPACSRPFAR